MYGESLNEFDENFSGQMALALSVQMRQFALTCNPDSVEAEGGALSIIS